MSSINPLFDGLLQIALLFPLILVIPWLLIKFLIKPFVKI